MSDNKADKALDQDVAALKLFKEEIAARLERKKQSTPGIDADGNRISRDTGLLAFIRYFWDVLEPEAQFIEGWVLDDMARHLEAVTLGKITHLMVNVSPGSMKAISSDEPVLTTWGWKRHGDLAPGDFVFGPDGEPKRVLGCTLEAEEEAYEISFDDGAKIVAGAGHLWQVEREVAVRPRRRETRIVTTPQLRPSTRAEGGSSPDRIPVGGPIKMPPRRLLIEPYMLGCWLGDGATKSGAIYAAEQDMPAFATLGRVGTAYPPSGTRKQAFYRLQIDDLQIKLRILGLLGNKHIPDDYMEASVEQRLALLQGLMDTDGMCTVNGEASFTNKLGDLAHQVKALVESLGMKAFIRSRYTILDGKKYGPHFRVSFTPSVGMTVFRLDRKQARVRPAHSKRTCCRYIESVVAVGPRVVKCIQVEGGLYLVGRELITTHNSLLTNVFFPAWEWGPMKMPHLRYVSFAYSSGLTERDNIKFRKLVQSEKYKRLWGDVFELEKEGEIKITNNKTGSKFASSVTGIGLGERGDRVILDDPHDVKRAESDVVRTSTLEWFRGTITDRLNNPERSAIIIIMQRVHMRDICGMILDDGWDYCHMMVPEEFEAGRVPNNTLGWVDPRTEDGDLAWPERRSAAFVDRAKKEKGSFHFAGQYQQRPAPRSGGIIKFEHWQPYNKETAAARFGMTYPKFPPMTFTVMAVDTAQTEKKQNDPSAAVLLGVCQDTVNGKNMVMLMYAWADRLEFYELCSKVEDICKRYRVDKVIIEDKASGLPLASELRRRARVYQDKIAHGKDQFRDHANFTVQTVRPDGDKVSRAYAVQGLFESGVVWAPCDDNGSFKWWADLVMKEAAELPKGAHDDLVDALVYGLKFLRDVGVALMPDDFQFADEDAMKYKRPEKAMYPGFSP